MIVSNEDRENFRIKELNMQFVAKVIFCGIFIISELPQIIYAAELPPLGKRKYIIEDSDVFKLSVIKFDKASFEEELFLKDPILPKKDSLKLNEVVEEDKKKSRIGMEEIKTAKLVFEPYKFSGRVSNPRLEFDQDKLPLFRVDEPVKIEYQGIISDTLSDLDIDL